MIRTGPPKVGARHTIIADKGSRRADPTRPQSTFLWCWKQLRKEVAKKYPHLAKLRFYDNRHTANTRMLENPAIPYNAIEHYMGHQVNSKTKRLYDHIRDSTIQAASESLSSGHYERPIATPTFVEKKIHLRGMDAAQIVDAPTGRAEKPSPIIVGQAVPLEGDAGTLTDEEAQCLFHVAQTKPRWRLAYLCGMVSSCTGAGAKEVLSLRLKDVDFNGGRVCFIEGTKPSAERTRCIPMNDDCRWALAEIVMMAAEKGANKPDHYIFRSVRQREAAVPIQPTTRNQTFGRGTPDNRR
jgi:integrase